jgi:hypothetical protein
MFLKSDFVIFWKELKNKNILVLEFLKNAKILSKLFKPLGDSKIFIACLSMSFFIKADKK